MLTTTLIIALLQSLPALAVTPGPALVPPCLSINSCPAGLPNTWCDQAGNPRLCGGNMICQPDINLPCIVNSSLTVAPVDAAVVRSSVSAASGNGKGTTVLPGSTGGVQQILSYPPQSCASVFSYGPPAQTTCPFSTSLATWISSAYIPVTTPVIVLTSPTNLATFTLPWTVSAGPDVTQVACTQIVPFGGNTVFNGGHTKACKRGQQMASTYQPVQGNSCETIEYDAMNALVAAYPVQAGENNPYCGRELEITAKATGNKITVTIVDACPTCWGIQDVVAGEFGTINGASIDLGPAAWRALFGLDPNCGGVFDVEFTPFDGPWKIPKAEFATATKPTATYTCGPPLTAWTS